MTLTGIVVGLFSSSTANLFELKKDIIDVPLISGASEEAYAAITFDTIFSKSSTAEMFMWNTCHGNTFVMLDPDESNCSISRFAAADRTKVGSSGTSSKLKTLEYLPLKISIRDFSGFLL